MSIRLPNLSDLQIYVIAAKRSTHVRVFIIKYFSIFAVHMIKSSVFNSFSKVRIAGADMLSCTFCPESAGNSESMSVIIPSDSGDSFDTQLDRVISAVKRAESEYGDTVFARIFLSDPANQEGMTRNRFGFCHPVSIIGQCPLPGFKIAAWIWSRKGITVTTESDNVYHVVMSDHDEYWAVACDSSDGTSMDQTDCILEDFRHELDNHGLTFQDHCLRTWFFARDIDNSYAGLVVGRNRMFDRVGLTHDSHFIASTGIAGIAPDPKILVRMDAFASRGFKDLRYLYAEDKMNRTSQYNVRFERGTAVDYSDRRHVFISGTASIDDKGKVMHVGDVRRQVERMLENVETLLAEGGCSFRNVMIIIVYLRDIADYAAVNLIFKERFPEIPYIVLHAAVCRPTWLVEMECIAIREL